MASEWQLRFQNIKERLGYLLESKKLHDCMFMFDCDQSNIPSHKVVMAMASPVLQRKLEETNLDTDYVVISDVTSGVFKLMMKYIYTDAVDIDSFETGYSLSKAAKNYELPFLEKECIKFIMSVLTPKNVLRAYELILASNDMEIIKKCEKFIQNNTKDILRDESFKEASVNILQKVYSLDPLEINSELDLLKALDGYARHHYGASGTPNEIRTVLKKIRFLSLTPQQFTEGRVGINVLSPGDACAILANLTTTHSEVPMPEGFSVENKSRQNVKSVIEITITEITFPWRIEKFADLKGTIETPTFFILDLPFIVSSEKITKDNKEFQSIYVECNYKDSSNWSCNLDAVIELVGLDGTIGLSKKFDGKEIFTRASPAWGWNKYIEYEEILDPKNKYLDNGTLTFNIHIKVKKPEGINKP